MSREEVAAAFGRDLDPLAEHAEVLDGLDVDPFEIYLAETGPRADNTEENYRLTFSQWRAHMEEEGRHPACPSKAHVESFLERRADDGVMRSTAAADLTNLGAAYSYWASDEAFPHSADFDPFDVEPPDRMADGPDEYPQVGLDELRSIASDAGHYLDRAVLVLQLKLGLRASELCNVRLSEVNPDHGGLGDFYPDLGTHPEVCDRPGSLYVAAGREGNKSARPRVLPLDDEARRCLVRYLLVRPACGRQVALLSKRDKVPLNRKHVNTVWRSAVPDRLLEPGDGLRPVRSHFARHHFTTYWDVHEDVNSELVAYMRGDAAGSRNQAGSESMAHYLHVYYSDIEQMYRERVFKLRL